MHLKHYFHLFHGRRVGGQAGTYNVMEKRVSEVGAPVEITYTLIVINKEFST